MSSDPFEGLETGLVPSSFPLSCSMDLPLYPPRSPLMDEDPTEYGSSAAPQVTLLDHEVQHEFVDDRAASQAQVNAQFPPSEEASELDTAMSEDDRSEVTHDDAPLASQWQALFGSLVPVETYIPPIFPDRSLADERDPLIESFMAVYYELEAEMKADNVKTIASLYERCHQLWDIFLWIFQNHEITAAASVDQFFHIARINIPVWLSRAGYALNSLPSTKVKLKAYDKVATVHIVRDPVPCAVSPNADIGPVRFELVKRPGMVLSAPVGCHVTIAKSHYANWLDAEGTNASSSASTASSSSKAKDKPFNVISGQLTLGEDGVYELDRFQFTNTSNGHVVELNFAFTLSEKTAEGNFTHTVSVRSLPIACVSNIGSQWSSGEGRYVAALAFGILHTTKNGHPLSEIRYPALFNTLQFAHLTCTRQIGSQFYIARLGQHNETAIRHFERKRTSASSTRSKQANQAKDLYQSFITYSRVQRLLQSSEVRSIFPPTSTSPFATSPKPSKSNFVLPDPDDVHNDQLEMISYDSFCKRWKWYGELMYKIYTGQTDGVEFRSLWLQGLIHLVGPNSPSGLAILDSHTYGIGSALIRTSRTPGSLTYAYVQARAGRREDYAYKIVAVQGNDYSSTLAAETSITRLLNISGTPIEKDVVVAAYKGLRAPPLPPPRDDGVFYRSGLGPVFESLDINPQ